MSRESVRKRATRSGLFVLLVAVLSAGQLIGSAVPAEAHGAMTLPGSRTYLCRIDGTHSSGDIVPNNPACAEAIAIGGKQPLWDWFGVLRGDGAGRTRGYIPDGQLCSGGEPKFAGYDQARADWPHTSLTAGAAMTFRYNAWAAHPGEFRMYITRDGYDPNQPLGWDDLEDAPFSTYTQSNPNGQDESNNTPDYQWTADLPQKSGRHIIYSIWERSDSEETFYGCSDVVFDGGTGQVVNIGAGAQPVSAPDSAPRTPTTTTPPPDADPGDTATTVPAPDAPADGDGQVEGQGQDAQGAQGAQGEGMADGAAPPAEGGINPVPADELTLADGDPTRPAASVDGEGVTPDAASSSGTALGTILLVGVVGMLLGALTTMALFWLQRSRRLEAELRQLRDETGIGPHRERLPPPGPPLVEPTVPQPERELLPTGRPTDRG